MLCKICERRRPRRFCPGVAGDICAVCCGQEREVTVGCPLDCEYLREAREHERLPPIDPGTVPNADVRVTESFLQRNEPLLVFTSHKLAEIALRLPGAVDFDVREALESLIRTFRTLESGLYYETRPNNPLAAGIHGELREALDEFRQRAARELGIQTIRDADVLGILVFLQRMEYQHNNGRRRGRAFVDFLRSNFRVGPDEAGGGQDRPAAGSPLILP